MASCQSPAAAAASAALLEISCIHGVADLHALIAAKLRYAAAEQRPAVMASELACALAGCPASLFAHGVVELGPSGPNAPTERQRQQQLSLWPELPAQRKADTLLLPLPTLPAALAVIESLTTLGAMRLLPNHREVAALLAAAGPLPSESQAVWHAAERAAAWPRVRLSPRFSPMVGYELGRRRGKALRQLLARRRLLERPLAVWCGPRAPTALLSPYVREVGHALSVAGPAALNASGVLGPWPSGPNAPYALADALAQLQPSVATERAAAEAAAGIEAYSLLGMTIEVIDAAGLMPAGWDGRLPRPAAPPWPRVRAAPVLLRCPGIGDNGGQVASHAEFAGLLAALGAPQLQSLAIVEAAQPNSAKASAMHPRVVRAAGPHALTPTIDDMPLRALAARYGAHWQPGDGAQLAFDGVLLADIALAAEPATLQWARLAAAEQQALADGLALAHRWLTSVLGLAPEP